jgi:quercetin 2,3-dioxygenase
MIEHRPFDGLGKFQNSWLNARHHFSFGQWHDPRRMGWGALRVWNDDIIQPGTGFDPHGHSDMEIITYVRTGAITHQDNQGNQGRTVAGDVQVMSAGSGIVHAEYNRETEATTIFQIWVMPTSRGGKPYWDAATFPKGDRNGVLVPLASGAPKDQASGALPIRADARVLGGTLLAGQSTAYPAEPNRFVYLALAKGAATVNGLAVSARDGVAITAEKSIEISATEDAEIILVDAPPLN